MAGYIGKAQSQALLNVETDKITEGDSSVEIIDDGSGNILFTTDASEAARVDASGNLLVGTTNTNPAFSNVAGTVIRNDGLIIASRTNNALDINRKDSDGSIINFRKDGTTVGTIGANGGEGYFSSSATGIKGSGSSAILPTNNTGASADGNRDLGSTSVRWRNAYLSGGVFLGGTGAANKLEDYETGTWTPVVSTDGTSTGIASISNAEYIKIGSVVHLHCQINLNSSGRLTSGTDISGQPFAASRFGGGTYSGASSTSYGGIAVVFTSVFKLREDLKTSNAGNWYVTITYHTTA